MEIYIQEVQGRTFRNEVIFFMKIVHYGMSENYGGIESYLYKISRKVDTEKFSFSFIDMTHSGIAYENELRGLGIQIYKITPRLESFKKNKSELIDLFSKEKFDVLHCHINTLSYITPILIALKHGCKVIVHSRSSNVPSSWVTKLLHYINFYRAPFHQTSNVAVSTEAGEWLFKKEFQVINNGIEIEKYRFDLSRRSAKRKELGVGEEVLIGHLGAFTYAKNHSYILEVFMKYHHKNPQSKLLLVGDGPLKKEIVSKIKNMGIEDDVMIISGINEVRDYLCAMDLMIFPSFYEGYPNAVLEAQTNGLPVIMSSNITSEVCLTEKCYYEEITEDSIKLWIEKVEEVILNQGSIDDRYSAGELIKNKNKDVTYEIERIEALYQNLKM